MDDIVEWAEFERPKDIWKERYRAFRDAAAMHPRYRSLVFDLDGDWDVAPFRQLISGQPPTRRESFINVVEQRPNQRLGMLMMRHQARSRVRMLRNSPHFNKYKYALTYQRSGCNRLLSETVQLPYQKNILALLGVNVWQAFHLDLGDGHPRDDYTTYWDGADFIGEVITGGLWSRGFADEPDLLRYYRLLAFAPYVRDRLDDDSLQLARSARGLYLWEMIDKAGDAASGFTSDLPADPSRHLSPAEARDACLLLRRKAMQ